MLFLVLLPVQHDWAEFGIAVAVILSSVMHKFDSWRVRKALSTETKRQNESSIVRDEKLDSIHALVNGTMLDQKKITMIFAKRIAELTQNPSDITIADEAEREYIEHQRHLSKNT